MDANCALMYPILYRGLEHLDLRICGVVLKPIPQEYRETTKVFGSQGFSYSAVNTQHYQQAVEKINCLLMRTFISNEKQLG